MKHTKTTICQNANRATIVPAAHSRANRLTVLFIFFLLALSMQSFSQSCLVNSIRINTGYDPLTGGTITANPTGCAANTDPRWVVTYISPAIIASVPLSPYSWLSCTAGPLTLVTTPGAADVVIPDIGSSFPSSEPGGYISCVNNNWFNTDGTGPSPAGSQYYIIVERSFYVCNPDNITFDLNIDVDNYVESMDVDGQDLGFSGAPTYSASRYHYITTKPLSCGLHKLHVKAWNFNAAFPIPGNGFCLGIWGTVASTANSLVSESAACTGYSCGALPISGPSTFCLDSTITLSNPFAGGTWSDPGYEPVATVDPVTGVVTGITPGTAIISYTTACGYVSTDTITVINCHHPCADNSNLVVTSTPAASGGCMITVTANVATVNMIVGYQWSGIGSAVIHHSHAPTDAYSFLLPPGGSAVVTCVVYIVDTSFTDSTGPCCQVVMTQTVTCAMNEPCCLDPQRTFLSSTVSHDAQGSCIFHITANTALLYECQFLGYIWSYPGFTSGIVPWNTIVLPPVPPSGSTWVTVTFLALNANGDTCRITRRLDLSCDGAGAGGRQSPQEKPQGTGESIKIFPNPTSNTVTISSSSFDINTIQVIDVNGRKVGDYSYSNKRTMSISLEKLPPGAYLFRVNDTTTKVVTKTK
jgi:hypothetical protein